MSVSLPLAKDQSRSRSTTVISFSSAWTFRVDEKRSIGRWRCGSNWTDPRPTLPFTNVSPDRFDPTHPRTAAVSVFAIQGPTRPCLSRLVPMSFILAAFGLCSRVILAFSARCVVPIRIWNRRRSQRPHTTERRWTWWRWIEKSKRTSSESEWRVSSSKRWRRCFLKKKSQRRSLVNKSRPGQDLFQTCLFCNQ